MNILIFAVAVWGVCKLLTRASRNAKQRRAARELEEIKAENARRAQEARELREEWKRQEAKRKAALLRQIEIEKEQARQRAEQERQRVALERQAAELDRIRFRVEQANKDTEFYSARIAELYAQLDYVLLMQAGTIAGSKTHEQYQRKIVTLHNQIHSAEQRLARAQNTIITDGAKLSA